MHRSRHYSARRSCRAVGQSRRFATFESIYITLWHHLGVNVQQRHLADNRRVAWCRLSAEYRNILNDYLLRITSASMRDVTLVILNSLRIKCHIRRPLNPGNVVIFSNLMTGKGSLAGKVSVVKQITFWAMRTTTKICPILPWQKNPMVLILIINRSSQYRCK